MGNGQVMGDEVGFLKGECRPNKELLNINHYPAHETIGDSNETGKLQHEQLCKK